MKIENYRKYSLLFTGVFLGVQYFGFVISGNIPYTEVTLPSVAHIPLVLSLLIIYFTAHYVFYWFKEAKENKSYFEIATSVPFALIAISPVVNEYLLKNGIDWKVITAVIALLFLGTLLAIAIDFAINIILSIRTLEEMNRMGLGRIPTASKAFIKAVALLSLISIVALSLSEKYSLLFPGSLNKYWLVVYLLPAALWNFGSFVDLALCLGPKPVRDKAWDRLRRLRKAMDLHEMHYQFIGIEKQKDFDQPAIFEYVQRGLILEIQNLLDIGFDPNIQDSRGWSPLMLASAEGQKDIVKLLLEHGSNPNLTNYLGRSALMFASKYGYTEIVETLLKHGALPNQSPEFKHNPPLLAAAEAGHLETVKLLVEYGADICQKGINESTALDISMSSGHGEVAKYLRNKMRELDDESSTDKNRFETKYSWLKKNN